MPSARHGVPSLARTAAAEARGGEAAISPALKVDQLSCAVATRAVDVKLKAEVGDVSDGLEWERAKHGAKPNAAAPRESLCQH